MDKMTARQFKAEIDRLIAGGGVLPVQPWVWLHIREFKRGSGLLSVEWFQGDEQGEPSFAELYGDDGRRLSVKTLIDAGRVFADLIGIPNANYADYGDWNWLVLENSAVFGLMKNKPSKAVELASLKRVEATQARTVAEINARLADLAKWYGGVQRNAEFSALNERLALVIADWALVTSRLLELEPKG
ncbi:MAG: hypothetical protein ACOYB3_07315 [Azonexus sp.]